MSNQQFTQHNSNSNNMQNHVIDKMLRLPPNRRCADCNTQSPVFINLAFRTFICEKCAGAHIALFKEFKKYHLINGVRIASSASYNDQEIARMYHVKAGNEAVNETHLAMYDYDPSNPKSKSYSHAQPNMNSDIEFRKSWIWHKYIKKTWYNSNPNANANANANANVNANRITKPVNVNPPIPKLQSQLPMEHRPSVILQDSNPQAADHASRNLHLPNNIPRVPKQSAQLPRVQTLPLPSGHPRQATRPVRRYSNDDPSVQHHSSHHSHSTIDGHPPRKGVQFARQNQNTNDEQSVQHVQHPPRQRLPNGHIHPTQQEVNENENENVNSRQGLGVRFARQNSNDEHSVASQTTTESRGSYLRVDDHIKKMMRLLPNKRCADCAIKSPRFVNLSYKSFVCGKCAEAHAKLSHKVVELGKYTFTPDDIARMRAGNAGNEYVNEKYLGHYNPLKESDTPPNGGSNELFRMSWMMKKYINRSWYKSSSPPPSRKFVRPPHRVRNTQHDDVSISMNSRISSAQRNHRDYIKHNDHREHMKHIDHRDGDSISVSSYSRTGSVTRSAPPASVVHRDQRERDSLSVSSHSRTGSILRSSGSKVDGSITSMGSNFLKKVSFLEPERGHARIPQYVPSQISTRPPTSRAGPISA